MHTGKKSLVRFVGWALTVELANFAHFSCLRQSLLCASRTALFAVKSKMKDIKESLKDDESISSAAKEYASGEWFSLCSVAGRVVDLIVIEIAIAFVFARNVAQQKLWRVLNRCRGCCNSMRWFRHFFILPGFFVVFVIHRTFWLNFCHLLRFCLCLHKNSLEFWPLPNARFNFSYLLENANCQPSFTGKSASPHFHVHFLPFSGHSRPLSLAFLDFSTKFPC